MSVRDLDAAIVAVKSATGGLRTAGRDELEPAELSAMIGATRELLWNVASLSRVVAERYERFGPLRHDRGEDPVATVAMIGLRLGDVSEWLAQLDDAFAATHDLAARLGRP